MRLFRYKAGPDAPGYLGKLKKHYAFLEATRETDDPLQTYELLIEWLIEYLTFPPTKFLKRAVLRRASQADFEEIRAAVLGITFSADPKGSELSEDG